MSYFQLRNCSFILYCPFMETSKQGCIVLSVESRDREAKPTALVFLIKRNLQGCNHET